MCEAGEWGGDTKILHKMGNKVTPECKHPTLTFPRQCQQRAKYESECLTPCPDAVILKFRLSGFF